MKWGLAFASSAGTDADTALEICRVAEEVGFESVWGGEHVIFPSSIESSYPYTPDGKVPATPETPIPDPLIWLAYVAATAPTLRLGTCILILPQRNPLVLAKELATLDHLSGGRVELGIGVGWMREEFDALGIPWERRGARTDEYVVASGADSSGYLHFARMLGYPVTHRIELPRAWEPSVFVAAAARQGVRLTPTEAFEVAAGPTRRGWHDAHGSP